MSKECIALTSPKLDNDNEFVSKLIPRDDAERLTGAGFCFTQDQWTGRQQFVLQIGLGHWLAIELDPDTNSLVAEIYEPDPAGIPRNEWTASAKKDIIKLACRGLKQAETLIRKKAATYIDMLRILTYSLTTRVGDSRG